MPIYVVTGANRGLGLEFCRQVSADASNIVVAGSRSLTSDLSDLESLNKHDNIHILECDTSVPSSIESFAQKVTKTIGSGTKIDYIINNAATNSVPAQTSLDMTQEDFLAEVNVNVMGPAKIVQTLGPHLQKGSVVMNMTSGLGSCGRSKGMVPRKCATYSISKAAVDMLTIHQAFDYGTEGPQKNGAVVICMDPGWVKTRMGGKGAILTPAESIGGMLKTLHRVGEADTGKFYTYSGEEVPW